MDKQGNLYLSCVKNEQNKWVIIEIKQLSTGCPVHEYDCLNRDLDIVFNFNSRQYKDFQSVVLHHDEFFYQPVFLTDDILEIVLTEKGSGINQLNPVSEILTQKERIQNILESTHLGTWEWNVQTGETIFNARWAEIIGYTLEELQPIDINTWVKYAHPDDLVESGNQLTKHFNKEIDYYDFDSRMKHKNGHWVWVHDRGRVIEWDQEGRPTWMFGTHTDITERKRILSELEYKDKILDTLFKSTVEILTRSDYLEAIRESFEMIGKTIDIERIYLYKRMPDSDKQIFKNSMLMEWKKEGDIPLFNHPLLNNFQVEKVDPLYKVLLSGSPFLGLIDSFNESERKTLYLSIGLRSVLIYPIHQNQDYWGFIGFASKKEDLIWTEIEKNLLSTFSNMISRAVERSSMEEDLRHAKELAEDSSKAKSEFLANMSHEIRTPLNAVIGFSRLMLSTKQDEIQKQYTQNINNSASSLLDIINDILDFSKIEAGKMELEINPFNLNELIYKACDVIKYTVFEKNLSFIVNIHPQCPDIIYSDEIRIKQILLNLLSNAVKFTAKGSIELNVNGKFVGEECLITLSVRDTGIGMDQDKYQNIFTAFSQEDTSTTRRFGGTGLGLSISSKLLDKMGSKLQVESTLGTGSCFYFTIKTKYEKLPQYPVKETVNRVLIMEEDPSLLEQISTYLDYYQVPYIHCKKKQEAFYQIIKYHDISHIILDNRYSFIEGITLAQYLKSLFQEREIPELIMLYEPNVSLDFFKKCNQEKIPVRIEKPVKLSDLNSVFLKMPIQKGRMSAFDEKKAVQQILTPFSILLAEDNEINMTLSKALLKNNYPSVVILEARNGLEAVELFKSQLVDLVLMDIQMPVLNGFEASEKIIAYQIENDTKIPVIALTAGATEETRKSCYEAGMSDFLTKPINEKDLYRIIAKYVSFSEREPLISDDADRPKNSRHWDRESVLQKLNGDQNLMNSLIDLSLVEIAEKTGKLKDYVKNNNLQELRKLGHTLKGIALNMGFYILEPLAIKLEKCDENENISELVEMIVSELANIIEEISKK